MQTLWREAAAIRVVWLTMISYPPERRAMPRVNRPLFNYPFLRRDRRGGQSHGTTGRGRSLQSPAQAGVSGDLLDSVKMALTNWAMNADMDHRLAVAKRTASPPFRRRPSDY